MDEFGSSEETAFIVEQIEPLLTGVVETVLKEEAYDDEKTQKWVDSICDGCMKVLVDQNKPFKYTGKKRTDNLQTPGRVTCNSMKAHTHCSSVSAFIMQRNGAGVHHTHTTSWDAANDNVIRIIYPPPGQREQKESHL
jgi:dynein light chain Tctex-type 1